MNINNGKIESIFSENGNFDKKNKVNRLNKKVDQSILEQIEQGITIENLETICKSIPVFKYKTQITIHGIFNDLSNNYINRYKSIFQNKNRSIGVKYNAIDSDKKSKIRKLVHTAGYSAEYNSTENYIYKSVRIKNQQDIINKGKEFQELYNRLDNSLFFGTKQIYVINVPWYGKFLIYRINLHAIYEKNIPAFIFTLTGKTVERIQLEIEKKEIQNQKENEKWKKDLQEKFEQSKIKKLEQIENLKKTLQVLTEYPKTGNFTLFYLKTSYSGNIEKKYIYIYDYKGKRYIEREYELCLNRDKGKVFPRKLKNKISIDNFVKALNKTQFFIESNSVIFG